LHPRPETQHTTHLRFRQAYAAVSFQRQGFEGGAGKIGRVALNDAGNIEQSGHCLCFSTIHLPESDEHAGWK
jgi:hypothetical protein